MEPLSSRLCAGCALVWLAACGGDPGGASATSSGIVSYLDYTTPTANRCYPITQLYGPYSYSHCCGENSKAIDIGVPIGTPIYASADGYVASEGWESIGGIIARLNHGDGRQTIYAHLSSTIINRGQRVAINQLIGYSGNTGGVAPHLHWAVKWQGRWDTGGTDSFDYVPGYQPNWSGNPDIGWICP